MGPRTHGGWVAAMKSTSTGGARGLASRNAPVASTGTAPTPSTTATVTQTTNSGKSESPAGEQRIKTTRLQSVKEQLRGTLTVTVKCSCSVRRRYF